MIGIDTNILLRLWLNDDPAQNDLIDSLLAEHGSTPASLLVTDVVLAESIWTLRSAFAQDKAAQLIAVRSLLNEIAFAFEDRDAVERAVSLFEQGTCGFSDCLVVAKHAQRSCDFTATFDRGMHKLPGVKVLAA
jgi:predicted nucleic-acid-binding protein